MSLDLLLLSCRTRSRESCDILPTCAVSVDDQVIQVALVCTVQEARSWVDALASSSNAPSANGIASRSRGVNSVKVKVNVSVRARLLGIGNGNEPVLFARSHPAGEEGKRTLLLVEFPSSHVIPAVPIHDLDHGIRTIDAIRPGTDDLYFHRGRVLVGVERPIDKCLQPSAYWHNRRLIRPSTVGLCELFLRDQVRLGGKLGQLERVDLLETNPLHQVLGDSVTFVIRVRPRQQHFHEVTL
jgi:hypothetical protein